MSYIEIHLWDDWYESTYEWFLEVLDAAGVSAEVKDISFSGFGSQGDGARFLGNFYLNKVDASKLKELLPKEDQYLADDLQELAEKHPEIQGKITRISYHYYHSNTMGIGEYSSNDDYCDEHTEAFSEDEDALEVIFRKLADILYSRLEEEYNFQLADQTCAMWDGYGVEVFSLKQELQELRESLLDSLPSAEVQMKALGDQMDHLESAIEQKQSRIDQLESQFHYWKDNKSLSIKEFYSEYF